MGNTFTDRSQMYSKFAPKLAIESNNYKQIAILFDISTTVIWTGDCFLFMIEMFANIFITSNSTTHEKSVELAATLMKKKYWKTEQNWKKNAIFSQMLDRTWHFFLEKYV